MKKDIRLIELAKSIVKNDIFNNIHVMNELTALGAFDNISMRDLELQIKKEKRKIKLEKLQDNEN